MAERLTEIGLFIDEPVYIIKKWKKSAAIDKLAQLENILEKYDLEVEELEELLDDNKYTQNVVVKQLVELQNAKNEENTWKRACELASETLKQVMGKPLWIGGNIPTPEVKDSDYFYQQAKKENKKVQIHYCTNDETNKILGDIKIKDDFSTTMQNLAKMYAGTLKDLDTAEDKDN